MKKKTLLTLIALAILTLIFSVGCDANQSNNPIQTQTTTDTVAVTQPVAPKVTTPSSTTETQEPLSVRLMTFNLRFDTTSHPCMSTEVRGAHLMEIIKKYMPDSISFNEATNNWMNYLNAQMTELGYSHVSSGLSSVQTYPLPTGLDNRQQNPIFYQSAKYELLESDTFWLSETPELNGSVSWDSSCVRICTYAVLKNKESGAIYAHFGTHLDHISEEARQNSILVIESYLRAIYKKYGEIGIVLSGDFNDTNQSTTYKSIVSFMDDASTLAETKLVVGATANGYSPDQWEENYAGTKKPTVAASSPIDYIFLGKKTASVSVYTVVDDLFTFDYNGKTWTDHPISDHYGVFCEAIFTFPSQSITYDETRLPYRTTIVSSQTPPSSFEGLSVINDRFNISSTLFETKPIGNLFKNDDSVASIRVGGNKHGVWIITLTADALTEIKGISFTTGQSSPTTPHTLRIFISNNGTSWLQLGKVYAEDLAASTTYYISLASRVRTDQIKIIFSDCVNHTELTNLTVYGK